MSLLEVKNLTVDAHTARGPRALVEDVSFAVEPRTITALVGGSGSGKTTTGLAVMKLLAPGLKVRSGHIVFNNRDLAHLPERDMRGLRGSQVAMVFQEPLYAFNPVFRIGSQIEEVLTCHTDLAAVERRERVKDLLRQVEIPDPERVAQAYPHQLSGGLRQRAMLAQALAGQPQLIIADEPTSNLDVTVQARILALFRRLRDELDLSFLLITHDLGLVQHLSDKVVVLCEGRVVEQGRTGDVWQNPQQAYTRKLMEAAR
jgi:ABC-type glutathione transport system ATPase component